MSFRFGEKRPNQTLQPTTGPSDVWFFDDFNIKLRSKARSRRWWLSLFSLDDMRAVVASLLVGVAFGVGGCYFAGPPGKGSQAEAGYRAAAPLIAALDAFHHQHGYYPISLRQLAPHYVTESAVFQHRGRDFEGFDYRRRSDSYTLGFTYYTSAVNQCSYDSKTKKWDCSGYF